MHPLHSDDGSRVCTLQHAKIWRSRSSSSPPGERGVSLKTFARCSRAHLQLGKSNKLISPREEKAKIFIGSERRQESRAKVNEEVGDISLWRAAAAFMHLYHCKKQAKYSSHVRSGKGDIRPTEIPYGCVQIIILELFCVEGVALR